MFIHIDQNVFIISKNAFKYFFSRDIMFKFFKETTDFFTIVELEINASKYATNTKEGSTDEVLIKITAGYKYYKL